ncbi:MAG: hypothetical protein EA401_11930 [Planctomycetota bacterium]|nr:MAG: hypothetical protein EA401_11930 [Planctomycetota bacterium]
MAWVEGFLFSGVPLAACVEPEAPVVPGGWLGFWGGVFIVARGGVFSCFGAAGGRGLCGGGRNGVMVGAVGRELAVGAGLAGGGDEEPGDGAAVGGVCCLWGWPDVVGGTG